MSLVRKLVISLRSRGLRSTLFWTWFNCVGWHTFRIYAIEPGQSLAAENDDGFSLAVADAPLLARIQGSADFRTPDAFVSNMLKCHECLVGLQDGEPVHVMWLFRAGDYSRFFELGRDEAEINYCYTPPRFRGRRMFCRSLQAAIRLLGAQGIRRAYIATHDTNGPANGAITRAGFAPLGKVRHYGAFYRPRWRAP